MLILDRSGSMDSPPSGYGGTGPSKLSIAKTALNALVKQYGDRLPFGFESFAETGFVCADGVDVVVKPKNGTRASVTAAITAVMTEGSTNTGAAIDVAAALPEMNDAARPGSYIVIVTDGEPTCAGTVGTETDPVAYTTGAVKRALVKGVKTFVVGFGALPAVDKMAMNDMANAGGVPCTGATCNGQAYYAAEDAAGLQAAIDSISSQIVGEFGGVCDDSCYSNGCPNAGEVCVAGACKPDPCAAVRSTCAPTDYCYTDGTSPGTCTPICPMTCAPGESCTTNGCALDPCASVSCDTASFCKGGTCVPSTCKDCAAGQICLDGACKDDACRYVQCPTGAMCNSPRGTCSFTGTSGTGGKRDRSSTGCHFAPGERADGTVLLLGAFALAFVALQRRRRAS